ncbi:hypothetical protein B484DRAFT_454052 [Ochromonadaceae sp. CCMP2298]|nr:hypothetical protein B484DRAFT_454052 [Ochromonadaceae sp. CCMP2298]|mmetsp:Transcript_29322/g.65069  ORF Transcript_29322/g.65069 Transcript_29322/m.65069 type:complete len:242 (-) Transcript_29322:221-946(-)
MKLTIALATLATLVSLTSAFQMTRVSTLTRTRASKALHMSDPAPTPEPDVEPSSRFGRLVKLLKEVDDPDKQGTPGIYLPGPYQFQILAALAYVIPIVDASDLGKYMFEAYPDVGTVYNTLFGPIAAIYNGVPFLPFAVFFGMSYICRAPNFPTEVRFHWSQAFMLSLVQFLPSLSFGFLEKAGVPGMGIAYNTVFTWEMISCLFMMYVLLNPLEAKNPMHINVVGWAMRYMNYSPDMVPK